MNKFSFIQFSLKKHEAEIVRYSLPIRFLQSCLMADRCGRCLEAALGDLIDDLVSVLFNGLVSRLHSVTSGVGNGGDVGSFVGNGGDGSVGIGNGGVASDVGSIVGDGAGGVGQWRSVAQSAVRVVSGSRVAQRSVAVETSVGQHLVVRLTSSDGHQGSEDNLNQKMNIGII